jgi:uncharacterized protein YjdB
MKAKSGRIIAILFAPFLVITVFAMTTCENEIASPYLGIEEIRLHTAVLTLTRGTPGELAVSFVPANATDKTLIWSSDNPDIASVTAGEDGKGLIKPKARGTTMIRVKSLDEGKTASVMLIVEGGNDVTGVSLPDTLEIVNGRTGALTAVLTPAGATYRDVRWESSDPGTVAILSFSADGLTAELKALRLGGPVDIRVTAVDGGFTDVSEVTVVGPTLIEEVSLDEATLSIGEGGGASILTASITPSDATDQELEWTSSAPGVASVTPNEDGKTATVTGITAGEAVITVKSVEGNKTDSCTVTVIRVSPITAVELPETLNISAGGTGTLTATLTPQDTTENVTWTSSDESIVTVTNGPTPVTTLTGKKAGTATITATAPGGQSDTCTVSVGYKLVARTLKETLTEGTTPDTGEGDPVLFWGANDGGTWSKGEGEALVLRNAEGGSIGVADGTLPNVTLVYLENPAPTASSYTFRAKVSVSSSGNSAGFILGAIHDAAAYDGTTPIYVVGLRFTGNPAIRRVMRTLNASAALRADQFSSPSSPSAPALGAEYIYEIAWNGTAKEYTLTYTAGGTAYSATLKRGTGNNDINDTLLDRDAYYPGFIIGNNTITISEITLTVVE